MLPLKSLKFSYSVVFGLAALVAVMTALGFAEMNFKFVALVGSLCLGIVAADQIGHKMLAEPARKTAYFWINTSVFSFLTIFILVNIPDAVLNEPTMLLKYMLMALACIVILVSLWRAALTFIRNWQELR
jgi:hypothetical protein